MYILMHGFKNKWMPISNGRTTSGCHIVYISGVGCIQYVFALSSGFMQVYSIKWLKECLNHHKEASQEVACGRSWGRLVWRGVTMVSDLVCIS